MSLPRELQEALSSAGWTPGRTDQKMVERLTDCGVPLDHPAFMVLAEFGGLALGEVGPGEECSTGDVAFDLISDGDPNVENWSQILGARLVGFARTHNGHGQLYMSDDGRVFENSVVHDAFYVLGDDLTDALVRLRRGRRARPMLRPDQQEVVLYGDVFVTGDPALYTWRR